MQVLCAIVCGVGGRRDVYYCSGFLSAGRADVESKSVCGSGERKAFKARAEQAGITKNSKVWIVVDVHKK